MPTPDVLPAIPPGGAPLGDIVFVPGTSYPRDRPIARAFLTRLLPRLFAQGATRFVSYEDLIADRGAPRAWSSVEARLALLEASAPADRSGTVLIGRSSGAQVVTRFACHYPVAAVICLGYPFRHPDHRHEPDRTRHLRRLSTPTLIIQGLHDAYGGLDEVLDHVLSDSIRLHFVEAEHAFQLSAEAWDSVAAAAAVFVRDRMIPVPFHGLAFDEDFYRARHPDIAAAIGAGQVASGAAHFLRHGQREGRVFRLLPAGPGAP